MNISNIKIKDIAPSELYHHGIKGQKWVVQKVPEENIKANSKASSLAKNNLKIAGGGALGTTLGIASVYAGTMAAGAALSAVGLTKMHKDWQNSGKHFDTINKGYDKLKALFPKLLIGGAATGAALGAGIVAKKIYNKNENPDTKNVKHSDFGENDITHSGIKGMKWGIRRYQNEDGTLTDAGKVRYNANGTKKTVEKMTDAELAKANQRLSAEQNYNRLTGRNYKNRPAAADIALKAGISAVGGALLSSGAYMLRDLAKNPGTSLGKEYFKSNKMKTAGLLGILGASVAAISSTVTSLGGQASIQNIGDQKKK